MRSRSEWLLYVAAGVLTMSAVLWMHLRSDEGTRPDLDAVSVAEPRQPARELPNPRLSQPVRTVASKAAEDRMPALQERRQEASETHSGVRIGMKASPSRDARTGPSGLRVERSGAEEHTATARNEETKTGTARSVIRTQQALDRAFRSFLEEQGLPTDLSAEESALASEAASAEEEASKEETEEDPEEARALESLTDRYPVRDARVTDSGEVWVQLESGDATEMPVDEIMQEAAELYGDSAAPVKVVLWSGSRAYAVRTFFGDPIF